MLMKFFEKKRKLVAMILVILIAATGGTVVVKYKIAANKAKSVAAEVKTKAIKGSIKVEISGDGVIEPLERYDITPLVKGKILSSPIEEGQSVKKGDLLYKIEATDLEVSIQKTKNSIAKQEISNKDNENNLKKTVIYAGANGRLINFSVKVGETISTAKVGEILDDSYCIAKVPFIEAQIKQISVGQSATVTSVTQMTPIEGTVSKINRYYSAQTNGSIYYIVEIKIPGPNSLTKDSKVIATIGGVDSPDTGTIELPDTYSVASELAGRVKKVYVSNNDYVTKGQKLFELDSDSYATALSKGLLELNDAMQTLKSQEKQLEDYNITSPIDGIVLTKTYKEGDSIYAGSTAATLAVIANTTKVKFDMDIDELDISKLKIGQSVSVTADALSDEKFSGKITSIAGEGTASNGVSNYLVEVTIDKPGALKSGMNVNAKTIVQEKDNIIMVPAEAVQKKDGKSYVTLPADSSGNKKTVDVTVGINNKDYIEIVSGLSEGQEIVMPATAAENNSSSKKSSGMGGPGGPGGPGF